MRQGVEIRIHGIGNHDTFSSLGSAINVEGEYVATGDLETEVLQPVLTSHQADRTIFSGTRSVPVGKNELVRQTMQANFWGGHPRPDRRPPRRQRTMVGFGHPCDRRYGVGELHTSDAGTVAPEASETPPLRSDVYILTERHGQVFAMVWLVADAEIK